jgi:hypothetical protein
LIRDFKENSEKANQSETLQYFKISSGVVFSDGMALYELLHANEYNNKESHSEALKN